MMTVPFFRPSMGEAEKKAACDVIESGWLTTGKITHAFEEEFAAFTGAHHALAVNSNTSGLLLAMEACGVRPGTRIITTPYTFVATAACALHLGADVLFADVEPDSNCINPKEIEALLKEDSMHTVQAIVPVHIAGAVCDMQAIHELARRYSTPEHKIYVIEDAAHSFPSRTRNGMAGTLGDAGVFSFYATKTMTTGEGGMITTNSDELARRITQMRLHGMNRDAWDRYTSTKASWEYDIIDCGYKCNLPDVLSAIGREQLKKADTFDRQRKAIVRRYNEAFSKLDFIHLPPDSEGNAWHLYIINLELSKLDCDRNQFAKELQESGIGISMHFIPIFHFTYWKQKYPDYTAERFPNAEKHYQTAITLPLWPEMPDEMIAYVIETVTQLGNVHHVR
ncbi:MAG: DegT/DnrJ/EryC1/StrS family aminotransferase [Treponema sp.]|nr:DegT/DnrJ/EryC1/StrS family aminotransferase [Treponema sp.]